MALDWAASRIPLPAETRDFALLGARALSPCGTQGSNLDPELISSGIELAGFYLEREDLSFETLSRVLVRDVGQAGTEDVELSRYIHIWFAGARGILALTKAPRAT